MSAARELLKEADQQVTELVPEHNDHYDHDGQGQDARSTTAGPVAATTRSLGLFGLLLASAVLAHHGEFPLRVVGFTDVDSVRPQACNVNACNVYGVRKK